MSEPAPPSVAKPRKRLLGLGVMWLLNWVLGLVTVAVLAVGGVVMYLKSNAVTAPIWARTMIEARIAEALPQARVSFGEMAFLMDEGWRPRVRLRNVAVTAVTGEELIRFHEFKATFSTRQLLKGQPRPKDIALSGIVARLRRDRDGRVSVQTGLSGFGAERQAATLPELIGQVDDVLLSPALSPLRGVDLRALTLRFEDARSGRVWTMDGGRLQLGRDGDTLRINADLAVLTGGTGVATLAANYTSRIGETAAEFGVTFDGVGAQDIAVQDPALAWLGVLRAPISGSVRAGLNDAGRFTPWAATLQIGAGAVQPNEGTEPVPFDGARSYFSYDPDEKLLTFDELSVRSQWITGQASGTAVLGLDETSGALSDLIWQIRLSGLQANPGDLYETPVALAGVDLDLRLELNPFRVTLGRAQISDQGKTALVDGSVLAGEDGWHVALDAQMDGLEPERLLALWPQRAAKGTRKWLVENLRSGALSNIDLAVRRTPNTTPRTFLAFDYTDATVRFSKTLPLVTEGRGHVSLADRRLVVSLDTGKLTPPQGGTIGLTGSSFIIPDILAKDGTPAVVRLDASSNIEAALSLLNMPPLSVMDKAKLPVKLAEGRATVTGTLALSLKRGTKPKVSYHVQGDLLDMRSKVLVKDRTITAPKLVLFAQNEGFSLTGKGQMDGVPFDAVLKQPVGPDAAPGILSGTIALTPRALETFGVKLPEGSVSGRGVGEIEVTLKRGTSPKLRLRSNLVGLGVAVPQVSWRKAASQSGALAVDVTLSPVPAVERLEVSGPGLSAAGAVQFNSDRTLERVRFDRLKVGNWLDVPLDLVGRGAGRPVQVALRGGSLDLRRAAFGSAPPDPAALPMIVALDRLQITDTISLTGLQGQFDTRRGLDGGFKALLNGDAPVEGRVIPQSGRSAVRLISSDAGRVLRAAGLLKQVVGGSLSLVLLPVGSGGAFDGKLEIGGVAIKDAPGIAALLNAVSVVGLVNELNGDGIYFEDVEGSFRLTPNRLTLTEASAVGASMGLSMDGTYALDTGQIAMQGVISPVYLLNGIGSLFTRKGEGLIGFNYTLSGAAKDPKVGVNPLSALTPAMFREIFRAPPPDLPAVEGVTGSTLPKPEPQPERPVERRYEGR
ncbi:YhdP family protein [Sulfitobacter pacificus]|uniref:YhdP family protein n=1 Tax=Sulfitobacter pacificus TaxID=1499314 RepID=UPI0031029A89